MGHTIPKGWEEKKLWQITNWDKRFNSVPKEKQEKILSFKHILAETMKSISVKSGNIKLLATGKFDGYTTEKLAGENLNYGEVLTFPVLNYNLIDQTNNICSICTENPYNHFTIGAINSKVSNI